MIKGESFQKSLKNSYFKSIIVFFSLFSKIEEMVYSLLYV